MCSFNDTTIYNNKQIKNKKRMKKNDRVYVMEDENGQPVICDCDTYLNHVLHLIKTTPNDYDLGKKIRGEYDMLKLSLIVLFNDDIRDGDVI